MQRYISTAAIVLAAMVAAGPARGDWFQSAWESVRRDSQFNNSWPEPFVQSDRAAPPAAFAVMVANGWRLQNTLSDYHFDAETAELSEAGRLRVQEILTEAPVEHRTLFVLRARTPEMTAARLQAVDELAETVALPGETPMVVETGTRPRGWPADRIDETIRKAKAGIPDPRLPARETTSVAK